MNDVFITYKLCPDEPWWLIPVIGQYQFLPYNEWKAGYQSWIADGGRNVISQFINPSLLSNIHHKHHRWWQRFLLVCKQYGVLSEKKLLFLHQDLQVIVISNLCIFVLLLNIDILTTDTGSLMSLRLTVSELSSQEMYPHLLLMVLPDLLHNAYFTPFVLLQHCL